MRIAIEEHLKCKEYPRVGAVIFKDGILSSTGFRGEIPATHAERVAIGKLNKNELIGSTLYTTLEPCIILKEAQTALSCSELIVKSGIVKVVIGVLDPNGTVYAQGYKYLLQNGIDVQFFDRDLRDAVEEETFEFGNIHKIIGLGKRRVPVVQGGIAINIQFSESDIRSVDFRWSTLQFHHGSVDLIGANGAVRVASGASKFSDITDPMVFRFPSHYARLREGMIAVVKPLGSTFALLVKLIRIYQNDILFQWEFRNDK